MFPVAENYSGNIVTLYRPMTTAALALPPRLLFTVMLAGAGLIVKVPLPLEGKVPISTLVEVLKTCSTALVPAELLACTVSLPFEVEYCARLIVTVSVVVPPPLVEKMRVDPSEELWKRQSFAMTMTRTSAEPVPGASCQS